MSGPHYCRPCLRALSYHVRTQRSSPALTAPRRSAFSADAPLAPRTTLRHAATFDPSRAGGGKTGTSSAVSSPVASARAAVGAERAAAASAGRARETKPERSIGERAERSDAADHKSIGARASKLSASSAAASPASSADPPSDPGMANRLAAQLRATAPSLTETYVAYGATEILVRECTKLADYRIPQAGTPEVEIPKNAGREDLGAAADPACWWFSQLGLEVTFNAWAQVAMLHLWLLVARLRMLDPDVAALWQQHLVNHFFYAAEDKMTAQHRLASKMIRQRYLKELFNQWRGLSAAYDLALVGSDADLAAALWRNLAKGKPDLDLRRLAETVAYVRSVLRGLEGMGDDAIANADIVFDDPSGEAEVVRRRARGMTEPLAEETVAEEAVKV